MKTDFWFFCPGRPSASAGVVYVVMNKQPGRHPAPVARRVCTRSESCAASGKAAPRSTPPTQRRPRPPLNPEPVQSSRPSPMMRPESAIASPSPRQNQASAQLSAGADRARNGATAPPQLRHRNPRRNPRPAPRRWSNRKAG